MGNASQWILNHFSAAEAWLRGLNQIHGSRRSAKLESAKQDPAIAGFHGLAVIGEESWHYGEFLLKLNVLTQFKNWTSPWGHPFSFSTSAFLSSWDIILTIDYLSIPSSQSKKLAVLTWVTLNLVSATVPMCDIPKSGTHGSRPNCLLMKSLWVWSVVFVERDCIWRQEKKKPCLTWEEGLKLGILCVPCQLCESEWVIYA